MPDKRIAQRLRKQGLLDQSKLKELLDYDPDTGVFTYKVSRGGAYGKKHSAGTVAGGVQRNGYRHVMVCKESYLAHRLAYLYMTGEWPKDQIDHINHKRDDNRWRNLREVNNSSNQRNATLRSSNTSGVMGVQWRKDACKWRAVINVDGKRHGLGLYKRKEDAINARKDAEMKYGFHENHGKAA